MRRMGHWKWFSPFLSSLYQRTYFFLFFYDMMVPIFFGPQVLSHLASGDSNIKKGFSSYFYDTFPKEPVA
jgi:hypothetical protein